MSGSLYTFSLVIAIVGCILAIATYRRAAGSPLTVWGARANVVIPMSIVVSMAPIVLFPAVSWARWTGVGLSLALVVTSFAFLHRQRRALATFKKTMGV